MDAFTQSDMVAFYLCCFVLIHECISKQKSLRKYKSPKQHWETVDQQLTAYSYKCHVAHCVSSVKFVSFVSYCYRMRPLVFIYWWIFRRLLMPFCHLTSVVQMRVNFYLKLILFGQHSWYFRLHFKLVHPFSRFKPLIVINLL